MVLMAEVKTGDQFEPAPQGMYAGVIKDVVVHEQQGESQYADSGTQVRIICVIKRVLHATPNRPSEAFPNPKSPEQFVDEEVFAYGPFNPTLKNKTGRWVQAILGEINLGGFDWHILRGKPVTITIGRSQTGGQKITELAAYVRQSAAPAPAPQTTTLPQPAAAAADPWDAEPVAGGDEFDLPF